MRKCPDIYVLYIVRKSFLANSFIILCAISNMSGLFSRGTVQLKMIAIFFVHCCTKCRTAPFYSPSHTSLSTSIVYVKGRILDAGDMLPSSQLFLEGQGGIRKLMEEGIHFCFASKLDSSYAVPPPVIVVLTYR